MELPDKDIINLLNSNSEEAFEKLFRLYYGFLCKTVYRVIPDKLIAEDLAQEVFYELWRKKDQLKINVSLKAYLRQSASNRALNYIRDQRMKFTDQEKLPEAQSQQLNSLQQLQVNELQELINKSIAGLPERCRIVFSLSRFEEKSYKEIAELLDISVKTVENQISKALKVLREKIGPHVHKGLVLLLTILN